MAIGCIAGYHCDLSHCTLQDNYVMLYIVALVTIYVLSTTLYLGAVANINISVTPKLLEKYLTSLQRKLEITNSKGFGN